MKTGLAVSVGKVLAVATAMTVGAAQIAEAQGCLGQATTMAPFVVGVGHDLCNDNPYPVLTIVKDAIFHQTAEGVVMPGSLFVPFIGGFAGVVAEVSSKSAISQRVTRVDWAFVRTPTCNSASSAVWLNRAGPATLVSNPAEVEALVPSGTYEVGMMAGGRSATSKLQVPELPMVPLLDNYAEAQQINPAADFILRIKGDGQTAQTYVSGLPGVDIPPCSIPSSLEWRIPAGSLAPGRTQVVTIISIRHLPPVQPPNMPQLQAWVGVKTEVAIRAIAQHKPLSIVAHPSDASVRPGSYHEFKVVADGPAAEWIQYQWYKVNEAGIGGTTDWRLPNETGPTLRLGPVTKSDAGLYWVEAKAFGDPGNNVMSRVARLTVLPVPPVINRHPVGGEFVANSRLSLSVTASGDGPLSYQWFRNGSAIAGANQATHVIQRLTTSLAGDYLVTVQGPGGRVSSSIARIAVMAPPVIVTNPRTIAVRAGQSVTLTASARGTGPLTYQWYKGNTAVADERRRVSGARSPSITITSCILSDTGSYRLLVTNPAGSTWTTSATLTVR